MEKQVLLFNHAGMNYRALAIRTVKGIIVTFDGVDEYGTFYIRGGAILPEDLVEVISLLIHSMFV